MSAPVRLVAADELGCLKGAPRTCLGARRPSLSAPPRRRLTAPHHPAVATAPDRARLSELAAVARWGDADRARGVSSLAAAAPRGLARAEGACLAAGRADGSVDVCDSLSGARLWGLPAAAAAAPGGGATAIAGVHFLFQDAADAAAALLLLSVTAGGAVAIHAPASGDAANTSAPATELRAWAAPPDAWSSALAGGALAVGCRGAELRLYDAATGELAFTAKGGRPGRTGLPDRPWTTALAFLPEGAEGAAEGDGNASRPASAARLVAGTGAHKLRLYDAAAARRPQLELAFGEARITALAAEPGGARVWAADGAGRVECWDLRAGRLAGALKGAAGSVRALALHPEGGGLIATAGLDRCVRVYDAASRAALGKVYLKTPLTAVAWAPPGAVAKEKEKEKRRGKGEEGARRKKARAPE
jgi:ribosome biogenesis protein NSA1